MCIPKIVSASSTLLSSMLNAQIEEAGGDLGNSFSSTVNSTEARPWCKTLWCLHQATGSEDSQGELSLFTSGKNSCCTGPLTFSALRSALWILPSAFLMRGPCMSRLWAMLRAGLREACFLNCESLCWVRKYFNPCVLWTNLLLLPTWLVYWIFQSIYYSWFWPKLPFLSLQCTRPRQSANGLTSYTCSL